MIIEIDNREIFVRVIFFIGFFFLEMQLEFCLDLNIFRVILHILRIVSKFKRQLFEQKNPLTIFLADCVNTNNTSMLVRTNE